MGLVYYHLDVSQWIVTHFLEIFEFTNHVE